MSASFISGMLHLVLGTNKPQTRQEIARMQIVQLGCGFRAGYVQHGKLTLS